MAFSQFDSKTALIVIDLQQGIVSLPLVHDAAPVIAKAAALAEVFRRLELPVILVNLAGGAPGRVEQGGGSGARPAGWSDFVPEMTPQDGDHIVTKRTWGAFSHTNLEALLRLQGVTQVLIAGIATSIGVESTARFAHELGFNVSLAVDAMTDLNADTHHNSITRIFPRLGEVGTTQDAIDLLNQRV